MTLDEARAFLRNDRGTLFQWGTAAAELAQAGDASFEDWLLCLSRIGYPAECGACRLYAETKRSREDETVDSFITDPVDWAAYLKREGFIA